MVDYTRLLRFVTFVDLPFSVFCCFTRVYEGHFMLCYKEEFKVEQSSQIVLWQISRGHGSARFPLFPACRFIEFDTSVICHVLVYFIDSFLLQDMFLSLQVFAFDEQKMMLTVNVLLTCILYCDAGPGYDQNCLQVHQADSCQGYHYLPSHVFLRRCRSFTSRKLYACLGKFLFLAAIGSSLCFWSSMYQFIPPLIVLVPQHSNISLYA